MVYVVSVLCFCHLVLRYFFQFDSLYVFPLFFVIFIFSIVTWFFFKAFWLFILISLNDRIVRIPTVFCMSCHCPVPFYVIPCLVSCPLSLSILCSNISCPLPGPKFCTCPVISPLLCPVHCPTLFAVLSSVLFCTIIGCNLLL